MTMCLFKNFAWSITTGVNGGLGLGFCVWFLLGGVRLRQDFVVLMRLHVQKKRWFYQYRLGSALYKHRAFMRLHVYKQMRDLRRFFQHLQRTERDHTDDGTVTGQAQLEQQQRCDDARSDDGSVGGQIRQIQAQRGRSGGTSGTGPESNAAGGDSERSGLLTD
jgi:hypothetical protein